jgi:hypothetical protein
VGVKDGMKMMVLGFDGASPKLIDEYLRSRLTVSLIRGHHYIHPHTQLAKQFILSRPYKRYKSDLSLSYLILLKL